MTNLSPTAQAVLDAYQSVHPVMHPADQRAVAAALRAAATQLHYAGSPEASDWFLVIANELEAQ
jgi:hypothetical protein